MEEVWKAIIKKKENALELSAASNCQTCMGGSVNKRMNPTAKRMKPVAREEFSGDSPAETERKDPARSRNGILSKEKTSNRVEARLCDEEPEYNKTEYRQAEKKRKKEAYKNGWTKRAAAKKESDRNPTGRNTVSSRIINPPKKNPATEKYISESTGRIAGRKIKSLPNAENE
jgi:hypothetical protein